MKNFKQLKIWQTGKEIALATYRLSQTLDRSESFTFSSQITRAALSIPSNIAEGSSRKSKKDYARFIEIALGSSFELETQLEIISELEIVSKSEVDQLIELINEEQRMLYGFLKVLKTEN